MANSIPDMNLTGTDWVDVYASTSIPVGTALIIQNKASAPVLIYISATKPTSSTDGFAIKSLDSVSIDASETGCWVRGSGLVNVQRG